MSNPGTVMETVLREINRLKRDGIIVDYAIGGAVAATFYMEPVETADLDIFVVLPETLAPIATLKGIYEALSRAGHRPAGEHVRIHGVLVQFLLTDSLTEDALKHAIEKRIGKEPARVMRPEHLAAIMVSLGRPKDKVRLELMLREASLDRAVLHGILKRHGLTARWQEVMRLLHGRE